MEKKKILIVDDEESILTMLESRLTHADYSVIKASNGTDAVAIAKRELPDLIITDIAMPDVDGGEVSQALMNDPATCCIPVIFLTALLKKEEEKERKVMKGRYFMAKPFDPEALLREVARLIEQG